MKLIRTHHSLLTTDEQSELSNKVDSYIQGVSEKLEVENYNLPEASLYPPFDKNVRESVSDILENIDQTTIGGIVVIGVGGSNLGTWAVYEALRHSNNLIPMHFLDTVDVTNMNEIIQAMKDVYLSGKKIFTFAISKSGSTTETIANYSYFKTEWETVDPDWHQNTIVITSQGSKFDIHAEKHSVSSVHIENNVGGRYSVLSAVGLLPLGLAGVDIYELLDGAKEMTEQVFTDPSDIAFNASSIAGHLNKGFGTLNLYIFNSKLKIVGDWYRQLIAESLGKDKTGILPIISIGSTDLHSRGQYYFGGPKGIFTSFINVLKNSDEEIIPTTFDVNDLVENIENKSLDSIMDAIYYGVQNAYKNEDIPFNEYTIDDVNEFEIGQLLQFLMLQTMCVAQLIGVNAFDQPHVELYKKETRNILGAS